MVRSNVENIVVLWIKQTGWRKGNVQLHPWQHHCAVVVYRRSVDRRIDLDATDVSQHTL